MKHAAIIQHVSFEDLGTLAPVLKEDGYRIDYFQAGVDPLDDARISSADLLVVLGGPVGVYEAGKYPWLNEEIALLRRRIRSGGATLGICLGAQLICTALGGEVTPGNRGKEIGWSGIQPVLQTVAAQELGPLFAPGLRVLHWHGDTFSLPRDAVHLARSEQYENQAFAFADHVLALQFHPEVQTHQLERWYIGHTCELDHAQLSITQLRADGLEFGPRLEAAAETFWRGYLANLS